MEPAPPKYPYPLDLIRLAAACSLEESVLPASRRSLILEELVRGLHVARDDAEAAIALALETSAIPPRGDEAAFRAMARGFFVGGADPVAAMWIMKRVAAACDVETRCEAVAIEVAEEVAAKMPRGPAAPSQAVRLRRFLSRAHVAEAERVASANAKQTVIAFLVALPLVLALMVPEICGLLLMSGRRGHRNMHHHPNVAGASKQSFRAQLLENMPMWGYIVFDVVLLLAVALFIAFLVLRSQTYSYR